MNIESLTAIINEVSMRWRSPFACCVSSVALLTTLGCVDTTGTNASSTSFATVRSAVMADPNITIRILPNLDGNNVTVTAFNQYDVVAGYRTSASGSQIFRSRTSIQYLAPPTGFQPGTDYLDDVPSQVGINADGQVVGGVVSDTTQRAFIWWHNGGTTLLNPTYPANSEDLQGCGATAITDGGYIGGTCLVTSNNFIAEWRSDGTVLLNDCCGVVTALTDNGYLTGFTEQLAPPVAFIWKPGAAYYELLDNTTKEVSAGLAVNPVGWVAGWLNGADNDTEAVLWVPGQPVRVLSHIGQATGVDVSGNVVGFHRDVHLGPSVAFLWNFATGAHFLPGLPNGGATAAVAISNVNREILGWAIDANGVRHAVIWTF